MSRGFALAVAVLIALAGWARSAPETSCPRPEPKPLVQEQDEYRSCDVAVRDFVQGRKEAAALPVKEVTADGLRMTLNFVHPYGESGDTTPNLSFTRGESIEERRKALNEAKQRARVLVEAARTGNVWYVVALGKEEPDKPMRGATPRACSRRRTVPPRPRRCLPTSRTDASASTNSSRSPWIR